MNMDIFGKYNIKNQEDALRFFRIEEMEITYNEKKYLYKIYVSNDTQNSKPTLVFIHGWGANATIWSFVALNFVEEYPIVVLDLPGHGINSEMDDLKEIISLDFMNAMLSTICEKWDSIILIGHSMGGAIAQNYLSTNERRIKAAVLIGTALSFRSFLPQAIIDLLVSSATRIADQLKNTIASFLAPRIFHSPDLSDEIQNEVSRILIEQLTSNKEKTIELEYGNIIRKWDGRDRDASETPILIIAGEVDLLTPLTQSEHMNMHYPNSLMKVIPQAHHNMPLFYYRSVVRTMTLFLRLVGNP